MSDSNTLYEYVKVTKLTDDFRRLQDTPDAIEASADNYCPVCLEEFVDARSLPCGHVFCRACLQYTIDRQPLIPEPNRGFDCVPNYSIPRDKWSEEITVNYMFPQHVTHGDVHENQEEPETEEPQKSKSENDKDKWYIDWEISAYSRSYLQDRGLNPFKRTRNVYVFVEDQEDYVRNTFETDDEATIEHDVADIVENARNTKGIQKEIRREVKLRSKMEHHHDGSRITAITFYQDNFIVNDSEEDVFDVAVSGGILFMSIPDKKTVKTYDFIRRKRNEIIYLTNACFGMYTFEKTAAILLAEKEKDTFQIAFLTSIGIVGGKTKLDRGLKLLKKPRHLAVCHLTRLAYVSDTEAGLVKCFRLDGQLCWESIIIGAGHLTLYNGYLLISREFTSSIDVIAGGGKFEGRLQSVEYDVVEPQCIAVKQDDSIFLLVDRYQLIHKYRIWKGSRKKKSKTCTLF
ncbi:hypothetical protein MAR_033592 [Mya arenaria]|uniref:RING-type domain-containing protein n=1 Tax=Mya arenaria TaxID=6604 RepID=A0ABY7GAA1_MYAAR|nr:hypothetical protein MAR_033592 [Mya arenaria]